MQPLATEHQEVFDRKVQLDWNYHSNKIEGNTLTYGETELWLIHGVQEGGHSKRNFMEMKAHNVAIKKVQEMAQDKGRPLTEADIRSLNKITLKEPFFKKAITPEGAETRKKIVPGEYKITPNHVIDRTGERFEFAEPEEVSGKMSDLVACIKKEIESPSDSIASFLAQIHTTSFC